MLDRSVVRIVGDDADGTEWVVGGTAMSEPLRSAGHTCVSCSTWTLTSNRGAGVTSIWPRSKVVAKLLRAERVPETSLSL